MHITVLQGGKIRTIFPTSDETILDKAIQLGREAKAAHQFTGNLFLYYARMN